MALNFISGAAASIPAEFKPSPEETWRLVEDMYPVQRNLVSAPEVLRWVQTPLCCRAYLCL
jgi:hypothetical protein